MSRIYQQACGQQDIPSSEMGKIVQEANFMQHTYQDQVTPVVMDVATWPECLGR